LHLVLYASHKEYGEAELHFMDLDRVSAFVLKRNTCFTTNHTDFLHKTSECGYTSLKNNDSVRDFMLHTIWLLLTAIEGRVMSRAVSCRSLTAKSQVRSRVSVWGICCG